MKTVGLRRTGNTCLVGGARGRCRYTMVKAKHVHHAVYRFLPFGKDLKIKPTVQVL